MAGYNKKGSGERRFQRSNDDRPRGRFGDAPKRFGDRGSRPMELHPAVCDACGQNCEVPFRPTGSKPVHCRSCFRKDGKFEDRRSSSEDAPQQSVDLSEINAKLDKIIAFLKID